MSILRRIKQLLDGAPEHIESDGFAKNNVDRFGLRSGGFDYPPNRSAKLLECFDSPVS